MGEWTEIEFGRIPARWEIKRISDLKSLEKSAIAMGPFGSNIKAENFVSDGVPVIRGTNLNFDKYVGGDFVFLNEEKADELKGSNCKAGDLVFTHRGTIGQVGLIPKDRYSRYVISQSGMKFTGDESLVDSEYLFYFFKSKYGQHQLLKNESQVGVPSISNPLSSLKEIEVPTPPLPEQKAIAEVLSSLDDKIDLLHRQNKTLESLAETLFRQWFIEEADGQVGKLGDLVELHYGKGLKEEKRTGQGFPVIGSSGIVGYHSEYIVEGPGIVIGRKGTLGKVVYVYDNFFPIDTTYFVKPKDGTESMFYEYFLLQTLNFEEMNSDSAVPGLNRDIALATEVRIPSRDRRKDFNNQCDQLFQKKRQNTEQIQSLEKLRDSLLPKLMSGEISVK
ncbi:MAG: restriction endonuclease subunit S [Chloracidobacterium sp.]|nr:restriction endonuclease subunit S [Chloracidobacterium sp.]